jgi:hypothetical protein
MKKNFYNYYIKLLIGVLLFSSAAFCQIPNAGFENWTSGNPDNWEASNSGQFVTITQSTDAHSGSYSVKGAVLSISGFSIPPALITKFAYTGRPASLSGFYKLTSVSSDSLVITVALYKNNNGIGAGIFHTAANASSFIQFSAPILYDLSDTPDSAAISITIMPAANPHSGSSFNIDDLAFGSTTAVNDKNIHSPLSFELKQNYPNPFNPSTNITYQLPQNSFVSLKIYNILGKEVSTLVNEEKSAGTYSINFNASKLASGIYFYVMQANNFHQVNKMMLLK